MKAPFAPKKKRNMSDKCELCNNYRENSKIKKLVTVKQFVLELKGSWPSTDGAVRTLIYDANRGKNNFQTAFKRIGRLILVDIEEFWRIVNEESNDLSSPNKYATGPRKKK